MSYGIKVKANAGTLSVTSYGDVPDGEFDITGHDDGQMVTIQADQRDELGRYKIRAQHYHHRSELDQFINRPAAATVSQPVPEGVPDEPYAAGGMLTEDQARHVAE